MQKTSLRHCPLCRHAFCDVLHTQRFVLPEGHPQASGYDVVSCSRCGFVFADTPDRQAEYDRFYAQFSKYEDAKTSTGSGLSPTDDRRLADTAACIAAALPNKHARILDIGCANGGLLKHLKLAGFDNLMGVDPSPACVRNTRRLGFPAARGSFSGVDEPLGQFDCVAATHVLEHVQDLVQAAAFMRQTLVPAGRAYIETPDATRYADFLAAPFQEFNTEHINHFSLHYLDQLMIHHGFTPVSGSTKTILATPGPLYPAAFGMYALADLPAAAPPWLPDPRLRAAIDRYIDGSAALLAAVDAIIQPLADSRQALIVWGTGELTMKLLAESSLGRANIQLFVDANPIHHGQILRDVKIAPPESIAQRPAGWPILIGTLLHHHEILARIRDDLRLPNPTVVLAP